MKNYNNGLLNRKIKKIHAHLSRYVILGTELTVGKFSDGILRNNAPLIEQRLEYYQL